MFLHVTLKYWEWRGDKAVYNNIIMIIIASVLNDFVVNTYMYRYADIHDIVHVCQDLVGIFLQ